MASNREYLYYVLELLKNVDNISYKKMMGEYLLYKDKILFGGIYDNRFLIRKTESINNNLVEAIPYSGAKPMILIDNEDPSEIEKLVMIVLEDLKK